MTLGIPHEFPVGSMLSAGQPDPAALRAARDAGYTMVVNLRCADEPLGFDERAAVESLGMDYRQIPVAGAAGVTVENARALQRALAEASDGKVLVHCGTANRVGALVAVGVWLDGRSPDEALAAGRRAGLLGLEPYVHALLSRPRP